MYICLIREVGNKLHLHGDEWENFTRDNLNSSVRTLHFVKEADDTFYITGYNHDGIEWQGYEELAKGNIAVKCLILPWDFLQDIWKNTFKVYINRIRYKVRHERVQTDPNTVDRKQQTAVGIISQQWHIWEGHVGHYTEDDVLYTMLNAPVYDNHRLTVPVEYSSTHGLDKYKKALLVHDDVRYTMGLKSIPDHNRPGRRSHARSDYCNNFLKFSILEVALDITKTPTVGNSELLPLVLIYYCWFRIDATAED
ncbi:hypothetical protein Tco_1172663 [Tanacetum coccineum]